VPQHPAYILYGDRALKHALECVDAKNQLWTHWPETSWTSSALPTVRATDSAPPSCPFACSPRGRHQCSCRRRACSPRGRSSPAGSAPGRT
jgi:hypothetical protein